jgi:hypothetical protein
MGFWVQMLVHAVISVGAASVLLKVVALGHAPEIVFVKKLARVALFAQRTHPMFADERVETGRVVVLVGTVLPQGTVSLEKRLAYRPIRCESELIFALEIVTEREAVIGS